MEAAGRSEAGAASRVPCHSGSGPPLLGRQGGAPPRSQPSHLSGNHPLSGSPGQPATASGVLLTPHAGGRCSSLSPAPGLAEASCLLFLSLGVPGRKRGGPGHCGFLPCTPELAPTMENRPSLPPPPVPAALPSSSSVGGGSVATSPGRGQTLGCSPPVFVLDSSGWHSLAELHFPLVQKGSNTFCEVTCYVSTWRGHRGRDGSVPRWVRNFVRD